ncbi:unnamed protein product [Hermetia illucens]|uniref:Uncharacterized protein n=1 Tax=Hermetia illucens TaxID=343691 RepID=A0A7R8UPG9_HERIL|nr:unnamed protein product [Hermetia illucens]
MDWTKCKNIKLPNFVTEVTEELLNAVESGDYSSDDSLRNPDFDPNWDQIAPEDDIAILQHLEAINLFVNLSIGKTIGTFSVEQPGKAI